MNQIIAKVITFVSIAVAVCLLTVVSSLNRTNHVYFETEVVPSASAVEHDNFPNSLSEPAPPPKLPSSMAHEYDVPHVSVEDLPLEKPQKVDHGAARRYNEPSVGDLDGGIPKPCVRHKNEILGTWVTICDRNSRTPNKPDYTKSGGLIPDYRQDFIDTLE